MSIEAITKWAEKSNLSHADFSDCFRKNIEELLDFLTELNEYVGIMSGGGKYPIQPAMISIIKPIVNTSLSVEATRSTIMQHILDKVNHADTREAVLSHDVTKLVELAHLIFDDLPKSVVDNVIALIESDTLDEDTYENVFEFVDQIVINVIKGRVLQEYLKGGDGAFLEEGGEYTETICAFFGKF